MTVTLAEARKRKGWTQAELAEKIGVYASQVSMYESGDRGTTVDRFKKLSEVLEVPMEELVLKSK